MNRVPLCSCCRCGATIKVSESTSPKDGVDYYSEFFYCADREACDKTLAMQIALPMASDVPIQSTPLTKRYGDTFNEDGSVTVTRPCVGGCGTPVVTQGRGNFILTQWCDDCQSKRKDLK